MGHRKSPIREARQLLGHVARRRYLKFGEGVTNLDRPKPAPFGSARDQVRHDKYTFGRRRQLLDDEPETVAHCTRRSTSSLRAVRP